MNSKLYIVLLLYVFATAGCRLIDDDLTACGSDYLINYEVRLVTEVNMVIDEELSSDIEKPIANALKLWSEPIFAGYAHDLDMRFYSLDGTDELKYQKQEIIDATRKSYTLYIPRENYRHLAIANVTDNTGVEEVDGAKAPSMMLRQKNKDTLDSHSMAVYSARLQMYMTENENLSFDVHLYMVSSALALVIVDSTRTKNPVLESVYIEGTATRFNVNDSAYAFYSPSVLRAQKVMHNRCFACVTLPSSDEDDSWKVKGYVRNEDNTVTESVLTIRRPLQAGTMRIIKVWLGDDGSLTPIQTAEVGASVTLDWKDGGIHDVVTG